MGALLLKVLDDQAAVLDYRDELDISFVSFDETA